MDLDRAFGLLIQREGGLVNNPSDPGGLTKYGISARAHPGVDIAGLTPDAAKAIYARDYWTPCKCDQLPDAIRYDVFDAAVNSGNIQAIKWLQGASGATVDGVIGSLTLNAAASCDPNALRRRFNALRLTFMTTLPTWPNFGRGWARRIADNLTVTP